MTDENRTPKLVGTNHLKFRRNNHIVKRQNTVLDIQQTLNTPHDNADYSSGKINDKSEHQSDIRPKRKKK